MANNSFAKGKLQKINRERRRQIIINYDAALTLIEPDCSKYGKKYTFDTLFCPVTDTPVRIYGLPIDKEGRQTATGTFLFTGFLHIDSTKKTVGTASTPNKQISVKGIW